MLPFVHACIVICSSNLWYDFIYFYTFELVGPKENGIRTCEFFLILPPFFYYLFYFLFFPSNFVFLFVIPYSISIPKVATLFSSFLNIFTSFFFFTSLLFFFCFILYRFFLWFLSFCQFLQCFPYSSVPLAITIRCLLPENMMHKWNLFAKIN